MNNLKFHLLALLVTILVAGSFVASAALSGAIHPISLTLLRFVIAAGLLLPIILYKKKYRQGVTRALPRALIMSLFFSLFFICMFEALKTTTALNTGTLYTLVPVMTAIFAWFIFKERVTLNMSLVYLLGITGTLWVIMGGDILALQAFSFNSGDVIFIIGCISMVCYAMSMKLLYRKDDMLVIVFCTLLCGAFWMLLALLVIDQPLQWQKLTSDLFFYMAYLAVCATLVSTFLIQKTTIILGPTKVMAYIYLSPVFVALIMLLIEGKSIPQAVIPGMLLSIAATITLQLLSRRKAIINQS